MRVWLTRIPRSLDPAWELKKCGVWEQEKIVVILNVAKDPSETRSHRDSSDTVLLQNDTSEIFFEEVAPVRLTWNIRVKRSARESTNRATTRTVLR